MLSHNLISSRPLRKFIKNYFWQINDHNVLIFKLISVVFVSLAYYQFRYLLGVAKIMDKLTN